MHEKKMMEQLINKILEIAKKEKASLVTRISVKLGALCHMDKAHFKEHFDEVAKGTIAENAVIDAELCSDIKDPSAQWVSIKSIDVL